MICFKCTYTTDSVSHYLLHLKHFHNLNNNDVYKCTDESCKRIYNNLNSFRKHLNSVHNSERKTAENTFFQENVDLKQVLTERNADVFTSDISTIGSTSNTSPPLDKNVSDCQIQESDLHAEARSFLLSLYDNTLIPRNVVQTVVDGVNSFIENAYQPYIKQKLQTDLKLTKPDTDSGNLSAQIDLIIDNTVNPFKSLDSEYKRFACFKETCSFIEPTKHILGVETVEKNVGTQSVSKPVDAEAQYIPLRETLKAILGLPNLLEEIKTYMNELLSDDSSIANIIQGKLWQEMKKDFGDKLVLPIYIYFDDYETGNALGSHAGDNKLGACYARIACMPPKYASNLRHTYLVLLFISDHRYVFGNYAIFNILIKELNYLREHGILVNDERVYVQLVLLCGDNLGLHSILGLTECFNANFPCRICKAPKGMITKMCIEDPQLFRTRDNYEHDVQMNNLSETGIKTPCIWHEVNGFHITKNVAVDEMHDAREGVQKYVMIKVINYLLFDLKACSLETLNFRIQMFNYGQLEKSCKPPLISLHQKSSIKLKMSASEMTCFVRYFGLMVGDLVPRKNIVWMLYLKLRQITGIIQSPKMHHTHTSLLKQIIMEHHAMYLDIFKDNLKPKFHFLLHYPEMISCLGPVANFSSMRYESKHKESKNTSNVSCSKVNIPYTLAVKHQLKVSYFLQNPIRDLTIGPVIPNYQFDALHYKLYFPNHECIKDITCVKWVNICGTDYTPEAILVTKIGSPNPTFGQICSIYMINETVHFLILPLVCKTFDEHYYAYEVSNATTCKGREFVMTYNELPYKYPCLLVQKISKYYVGSRFLIV